MNSNFYFSNEEYKQKALDLKPMEKTDVSPVDAFFLLIEGVGFQDLDLYCETVAKRTDMGLTGEQVYRLIQNPTKLKSEDKDLFFEIAKITNPMGSHIINVGNGIIINTSSWINHSLNVAESSRVLCSLLKDCDTNTAYVSGLFHDIGRKFKTNMQHTIAGFEYLVDKGYENEARICLTHSHIHGERCANNEPAVDGWSCVEGNSVWDDEVPTDDLTEFLQNCEYSTYDDILTIVDLIATENGVVSLCERLKDIASRRKIDEKNRKFFFAETINIINEFFVKAGIKTNYTVIKAIDSISLEEMEIKLSVISNELFEVYKQAVIKEQQFNNSDSSYKI